MIAGEAFQDAVDVAVGVLVVEVAVIIIGIDDAGDDIVCIAKLSENEHVEVFCLFSVGTSVNADPEVEHWSCGRTIGR